MKITDKKRAEMYSLFIKIPKARLHNVKGVEPKEDAINDISKMTYANWVWFRDN